MDPSFDRNFFGSPELKERGLTPYAQQLIRYVQDEVLSTIEGVVHQSDPNKVLVLKPETPHRANKESFTLNDYRCIGRSSIPVDLPYDR